MGVYATFGLVWEEIQTGNGCPKIWIIPACVIVLLCFLIPLIAHLLKTHNTLYFIFTALAGAIALVASIMQFSGNAECPKTDSGTPMCYYSLLLFSSLIILKIYYLKLNNQE